MLSKPPKAAAQLWDLITKSAPTMEDPETKKPDHTEYLQPAMASHGIAHPEVDDAVRALLVITGVHIKFVINYWLLQKGNVRGGVRVGADFEEWRVALNEVMDKANGGVAPKPFG